LVPKKKKLGEVEMKRAVALVKGIPKDPDKALHWMAEIMAGLQDDREAQFARELRLPIVLQPGHDLRHPVQRLVRILGNPFHQRHGSFHFHLTQLFLFGNQFYTPQLCCPPLFECLINIPRACPISPRATSVRCRLAW